MRPLSAAAGLAGCAEGDPAQNALFRWKSDHRLDWKLHVRQDTVQTSAVCVRWCRQLSIWTWNAPLALLMLRFWLQAVA